MTIYLQLEINIVAIIILLFILFNSRRNVAGLLDEKLFVLLVYSCIIFTVLDSIHWIYVGQNYPGTRIILIVDNLFFYFLTVLIPYIWTIYAEFRITEDEQTLWRRNRYYQIPLYIFTVMLILSPFTKWIFYVDENSNYMRGSLYMVQIALSFGYLLYPTVKALVTAHKTRAKAERLESYHIASFILCPLVGAVVQIFIYGLPIVSITMVISLLMIYVNLQNKQISLDALTKINNRGQLNRYLNLQTKYERNNKNVYLIIADVDNFKHINDTYGHKAGDQALIEIASIINNACEKHHAFPARYGGDEFAVVMECMDSKEIEALISDIEKGLYKYNEGDVQFPLKVSIGYAMYGMENTRTLDDFIEEADRQMYQVKKASQ